MYTAKIGVRVHGNPISASCADCGGSCTGFCQGTCEGGCSGACEFTCTGSCETGNGLTAIDPEVKA